MAVEVIKKVERREDVTGSRIFAVGDIHGRFDKLVEMVGLIEGYKRASNDTVVFLGDYVDKGPDSSKVIDFLINYQKEDPEHVKVLMGNHDYHFASFHKPWIKRDWGRITLESYVQKNVTKNFGDVFFQPYDMKKISAHRAYLKSLPIYWETKHFLFVHAGIDPTKELWEQDYKTMLFIRDKFFRNEIDTGHKFIVHGHHKQENGLVRIGSKRINVDTACYQTGVLSCVVLHSEKGEVEDILKTKADK